ncbi:hypothetical protein C2G38_2043374 [Gigaspora rosea]|uniref:Serine-threonine/tyrosine-protein kinase catalytic domain-containing protein n=1 Tax=Gigaspora rosea TaxID=44941 RepID=A0A397UJY6_9GLOM|nr:hypothetical protein C2G38_2043374 [Gigaspora rosea]
MSEMSTGQRGYQFNEELAIKICIGLRPEFAPGTPEYYVKLAKQCMYSDSQKRPYAYKIRYTLNNWYDIIKQSDNVDLDNEDVDNEDANNENSDSDNEDADIIKRQFLAMVKELQTTLPKHPNIIYTSKIINTQKISNAIKTALASKPIATTIPLVSQSEEKALAGVHHANFFWLKWYYS